MNQAKREWVKVHKDVYKREPVDPFYKKRKSEITTYYMYLLTLDGKEAELAKKMLLRLCFYEAIDG
mgnify:CR=1 FL=1